MDSVKVGDRVYLQGYEDLGKGVVLEVLGTTARCEWPDRAHAKAASHWRFSTENLALLTIARDAKPVELVVKDSNGRDLREGDFVKGDRVKAKNHVLRKGKFYKVERVTVYGSTRMTRVKGHVNWFAARTLIRTNKYRVGDRVRGPSGLTYTVNRIAPEKFSVLLPMGGGMTYEKWFEDVDDGWDFAPTPTPTPTPTLTHAEAARVVDEGLKVMEQIAVNAVKRERDELADALSKTNDEFARTQRELKALKASMARMGEVHVARVKAIENECARLHTDLVSQRVSNLELANRLAAVRKALEAK